MKYFLISFIVIVSFFGCSVVNEIVDESINTYLSDTDLYWTEEFTGLDSLEKVCTFLNENIDYGIDTTEHVQSPEMTWETKRGNSADIAVLAVNILYHNAGIKSNVAFINNTKSVVEGGIDFNYVVIYWENEYICPLTKKTYDASAVNYEYTFDTIFYSTTYF